MNTIELVVENETWKKFRFVRIGTRDLCDTGSALYQLS